MSRDLDLARRANVRRALRLEVSKVKRIIRVFIVLKLD